MQQYQEKEVQPHLPPMFGHTPKPHLHKTNGEWWVSFPTNWLVPVGTYEQFYQPWLHRMNGVTKWRTGAFLLAPHRTIQ